MFYKPWVKAKIEYESVGKLLFPNLDELIRIHSKFDVVVILLYVYIVMHHCYSVVQSRYVVYFTPLFYFRIPCSSNVGKEEKWLRE